jgi:hypothetical protein
MSSIYATLVLTICSAGALALAQEKSPYLEHSCQFPDSPVEKWTTRFCQPKYFEFDLVWQRHQLALREGSSPDIADGGLSLELRHGLPSGKVELRNWTIAKDSIRAPDPDFDENAPPTIVFGYELTERTGPLALGTHEVSLSVVDGLRFTGKATPIRLPAIKLEVVRFDAVRHLPVEEAQLHRLDPQFDQWKRGPDNGTAYWNADLHVGGDIGLVLHGYDARTALFTQRRVLCPAGHQRLIPDFGWLSMGNAICGTGLEDFTVRPGGKYELSFYEIKQPGILRFELSSYAVGDKHERRTVYSPPFIVKRRGDVTPLR